MTPNSRAPRRALLAALLALAAGLPRPAPAAGERFTVVVNADSKLRAISRDDLSRVFLGKLTLWEGAGTRVAPAMLDESSTLGQAFLEEAIKKSVDQYRAYWKRQLFSGGGTPPKVYKKSSEVLDYVARNPGGIGVVETGAADARVRVIEVSN